VTQVDARRQAAVTALSVPGAGVELACSVWPGDDPIVAVHGLTAHGRQFSALAEGLAGRHGVVAVDLRGRGDSEKPARPYGMLVHAEDVAAAMGHLRLGPSVLVGHSMGAYIATAVAARHPELVRGLVLFDGGYPQAAPPGVDVDQVLETLLAPMLERLRTVYESRQEYRAFWRSQPTFPPPAWNRHVEAYIDYDLGGAAPEFQPKASETAVRVDFRDMCDQAQAGRRLAAVRCPVVMIRAEHGIAEGEPPIVTDELARHVQEVVPGGVEDIRVAGCTHYTITVADPGLSVAVERVARLAAETAVR
jgi:pimeloyl-ACP methyl ester carboxylesterase